MRQPVDVLVDFLISATRRSQVLYKRPKLKLIPNGKPLVWKEHHELEPGRAQISAKVELDYAWTHNKHRVFRVLSPLDRAYWLKRLHSLRGSILQSSMRTTYDITIRRELRWLNPCSMPWTSLCPQSTPLSHSPTLIT